MPRFLVIFVDSTGDIRKRQLFNRQLEKKPISIGDMFDQLMSTEPTLKGCKLYNKLFEMDGRRMPGFLPIDHHSTYKVTVQMAENVFSETKEQDAVQVKTTKGSTFHQPGPITDEQLEWTKENMVLIHLATVDFPKQNKVSPILVHKEATLLDAMQYALQFNNINTMPADPINEVNLLTGAKSLVTLGAKVKPDHAYLVREVDYHHRDTK